MASHFAEPVDKNATLYESQLENTNKVPVDVHGVVSAGGVHGFPVLVENSIASKEIPVVVNDAHETVETPVDTATEVVETTPEEEGEVAQEGNVREDLE